MFHRAIAVLCLVILTGCGEKTIDATNADTFESSFEAVTAEMSEAERLKFAGAILTLFEDKRLKTILPVHIVKGKDAQLFLNTEFRSAMASELVQAVGSVLDGKSAEEIYALADEVEAKAEENALAKRKEQLAKLADDLKGLEQSVLEAEKDVEAKKAEKAAFIEAIDQKTALLEGVKAKVIKQSVSKFTRHRAEGDFELEVANETGQPIQDAKVHLTLSAKGDSKRVGRYGLKAKKVIEGNEIPPGASVALQVKDLFLNYMTIKGGLESPEQLAFSAGVDEIHLSDGTKIDRLTLDRQRKSLSSHDRQITRAQAEVTRLNGKIEEAKAELAKGP